MSITAKRWGVALASVLGAVACRAHNDAATLKDVAMRPHDLGAYECPTGPIRVAFFDADATLVVAKSGSEFTNGIRVDVLPFVGSKIAQLNRDGYLVAVVSSSVGVDQAPSALGEAEEMLAATANLVGQMGGRIDYLAMADDAERKPKTGMATRLDGLLREKCGQGIDLTKSFVVGDSGYKRGQDGPHPDGRPADDSSNVDRGFAKNLLTPDVEPSSKFFQEPTDYFGWRDFGVFNLETQGELEDFMKTIETRAAVLRAEGGEGVASADALDAEVRNLRRANGLTPLFRFVHYNIKELTTGKLVDAQNAQLNMATRIIRGLGPDLLSINEVQYDLPDVPTTGLPGTGDNMKRLVERTGLTSGMADASPWSYALAPANTGKRALRKPDGSYATDPNGPGAAGLADVISFGTFPGQYSTGFATRLSIERRTVHTDLKWADWDASLELGTLTLPNDQPAPADMELFDKNFNDTTVLLEGRTAHFITFHTVPAFGFGGSAALNIARNKAQLEFLEWYLLGECDPENSQSAVKRCETSIRPLVDGTPFIAVGDLNVNWGTPDGGAEALQRMLTSDRVHGWRAPNPDFRFQSQVGTDKSYITYMSDGVDLGKLQSELDYFIVSKQFRIASGKVAAPLSWFKEHGCHPTKATADAQRTEVATATPDMAVSVSTRYGDANTKSYCVVEVSKDFAEYRKGSDHLPVYVTFGWAGG